MGLSVIDWGRQPKTFLRFFIFTKGCAQKNQYYRKKQPINISLYKHLLYLIMYPSHRRMGTEIRWITCSHGTLPIIQYILQIPIFLLLLLFFNQEERFTSGCTDPLKGVCKQSMNHKALSSPFSYTFSPQQCLLGFTTDFFKLNKSICEPFCLLQWPWGFASGNRDKV